MGTKYFTLLTQIGEARLAEAISKGQPLEIAQMGVGDGGGSLQIPNPMQTKLVNERRRASINALSVDPNNTNQIIAEQVIPENEGGFWLREMGLYDIDGNLIAVANCPETYKPELKEGSGRVQTVRMILIVSRTDALTLNFDPTVALATRRYADTLLSDHIVAANPHKQYAPLASPALSGVPTAPTAVAGTNNSQLATTAFVTAAANTVSASVSATTAASLAKKLDIADIAGIPLPWPQASAPAGWLKCNGQAFDKTLYPKLAQVYPSGTLPDLRGEFIRGWDDGRGVDAGRTIGSWQESTKISGYVGNDGFGSLASGVVEQDIAEIHATYTRYVVTTSAAFLGSNLYRVKPRNVAFNYIVRAA
ncbi:phage tail protein [Dickeya lacustris]|uniref:Phage tail protein n=1 Tax=Dickeya lacustris TaxID=2259638 RepID=A0ABY8G2P8_9GAMM|nr:phage tail protein [Dickeya lacustris]WFN54215.1 phage tail protein [Dickeya lacustris]